jgi:hypothetical protein
MQSFTAGKSSSCFIKTEMPQHLLASRGVGAIIACILADLKSWLNFKPLSTLGKSM